MTKSVVKLSANFKDSFYLILKTFYLSVVCFELVIISVITTYFVVDNYIEEDKLEQQYLVRQDCLFSITEYSQDIYNYLRGAEVIPL